MKFTIELTEQELNAILQSLAQMPYLQVVELINKIHAQVKPQFNKIHAQVKPQLPESP
jgi:hypothetical protein